MSVPCTDGTLRPVQVAKHMLSRLLYPNPVCFLTTVAPQTSSSDGNDANAVCGWRRNIMTISWLTPLDNHGHFICSMKSTRYSHTMLLSTNVFVLNVPVKGMESLVTAVGACSGAVVGDKFDHLNIQICAPGWISDGEWPSSSSKTSLEQAPPSTPKSAKQKAIPTHHPVLAIPSCAAHLICRVEERQERYGHDILYCVIDQGFVKQEYWDGRNFAPTSESVPPFLSFLGTKRFAYTVPAVTAT
ncbi:uncharacterized protein SPPG_03480 [Spizellomyces punctatus DAOM BR117]|uniref:Flavin reductase like domain-containing protein n=1 Tax=Spizellomyces punctatus (strain DAOM BR117) TaxID=645134 RepID=A0A0L0HLB4_SPIPD|nr:uncharacterized protein SPPG_03480 [Spizellomyces punctatus DAOM BR117]KND01685.1 hypothetical protein SPPG_03480 [Spizellomyces punctatus DAOM BR117]|eukprot:XP_016609724.1 hypothetical protein SPPG_03480 [Spizellomyces punctatus DAOM BR117]